jgi:putative addiction module CopG family antidote
MSETLPADLQQFVREELATGRYPSERDLVVDAVRLLREARVQEEDLRAKIQARIASLERGEAIELDDDEALGRFFDEIEAEVDQEEGRPRAAK